MLCLFSSLAASEFRQTIIQKLYFFVFHEAQVLFPPLFTLGGQTKKQRGCTPIFTYNAIIYMDFSGKNITNRLQKKVIFSTGFNSISNLYQNIMVHGDMRGKDSSNYLKI